MALEDGFTEPLHVGRPNIGDRAAFSALVDEVIDRRWLTNDGPLVRRLEERIAGLIGVDHCIAMSNGTAALEIAIRAAGWTGEVIVPSFTFVATPHSLRWQGLTPVFADIETATHNLDPESVRRAITPSTTGILGVHLWGRPAAVDALGEIADEFGLSVIYDAAHAFGVTERGHAVGTFGRAEVFSFHATKFFNTIEGGAIVTNDDEFAHACRLMRNFGFTGEDTVVSDGTNAKMSEIHAAMGLVNLDSLDAVVEANRRNSEYYRRELAGVPGIRMFDTGDGGDRNHQYAVMLVEDECPRSRDEVLSALRVRNVLARRYFWPGCHRMEPYRSLDDGAAGRLPRTEEVAAQVIVLPNGLSVDEAAIKKIAGIISDAVSR